jgi:hypothetical protein
MISLGEVCVWESFIADTSDSERDMEIYTKGSTAVCFQTDCNGICREEIILSLLVDTIYPTMFLEATSSDDGMMYLVPVDTDKDLDVIRGACSDSIIAVMDTPVSIPLEGMENGTYWLYATDTSGYISEPSAFTVAGVGIEHKNTENLKIFPNPTYTLLTIEMATSDMINIEIISLNGQIQLSKELEGTTHQIDLSSFQTGIYFISIRSGDFVTTRKIVKF